MSPSAPQGATWALAEFAARTSWNDVPAAARRATGLVLLDGIGCCVAAHETQAARPAMGAARRLGAGTAPIIGTAHRCGLLGATLANGILTYALDFEAVGPEGHVVAATLPAALTVGAASGKTVVEVLLALAVGLEVGGRVGIGVRRTRRPGRTQAVRGNNHAIFGAAAAAGRLLGLDAVRMRNAFGIAGYSAPPPTLTRCMATPPVPDIKYDNLGLAAQLGVQAALLAAEGVTGDLSILDGDSGFWRFTGAAECDWDGMVAGVGDAWILPQTWFKRYPNSLYAAPAIDALRVVQREHGLLADDMTAVRVYSHLSTEVARQTRPDTSGGAGLSLPMNLACSAHGVQPRRAWHDPAVYRRDDLIAFAERVQLLSLERTGPTRPAWEGSAPVHLEVDASGRTYSADVAGLPRLSEQEILEKFRENVGALHDPGQAARVAALVLEESPSLASSALLAEFDRTRIGLPAPRNRSQRDARS